MTNLGRLLYSSGLSTNSRPKSKINEVAKTTEAYSPDMVRPSDVEKEVVKRDLTT